MKTQYLSLEALAAVLSLPQNYLRKLAKQKQIPSLKVGNRMKFQESEVREALAKMAKKKPTKDSQQSIKRLKLSREVYSVANKLSKNS